MFINDINNDGVNIETAQPVAWLGILAGTEHQVNKQKSSAHNSDKDKT